MFYQQALGLRELFQILPRVSECCFAIDSSSPKKEYHVTVYKYHDDFYVLNDDSIRQLLGSINTQTGNEDLLLATIEDCLETNNFVVAGSDMVLLDIRVLMKLNAVEDTNILFFRIGN